MTKESMYDEALKGVGDVVEQLSDEIAKEFKGKKPFDKEPVDNDQMIYINDNMTHSDMEYIINKYGNESVNERLKQIYQLKARRGL